MTRALGCLALALALTGCAIALKPSREPTYNGQVTVDLYTDLYCAQNPQVAGCRTR